MSTRKAPGARWLLALVMALGLLGSTVSAEASAGRAVARGAGKGAAKALKAGVRRALRIDRIRDLRTPARPLTRSITVRRYAAASRAATEARSGFRAGSHFTARLRPGRLPRASTAQRMYGLPRRPAVAFKVRLPKGQPVRVNKAIGGMPGRGEITSTAPIRRQAILKRYRLR